MPKRTVQVGLSSLLAQVIARFCAGQDLNEASNFGAEDSDAWIDEWRLMYGAIRSLSKPLIMALNGIAAGSAFQVALLGDIRVGHMGVKMGQPEIRSGLASITGPSIMKECLGISRTTELALSGRMMTADECHHIGLIHHMVEREQVLEHAKIVAAELGALPTDAMKETKAWLRMMTEPGLQKAFDVAARAHAVTFGSSETHGAIDRFLDQ